MVFIGTSISQILQRLDKYVYIYQENDCFYHLFEHSFYSSIVTSSWEKIIQLSGAVQHNLRWNVAKMMHSNAKMTNSEKNQTSLLMFYH